MGPCTKKVIKINNKVKIINTVIYCYITINCIILQLIALKIIQLNLLSAITKSSLYRSHHPLINLVHIPPHHPPFSPISIYIKNKEIKIWVHLKWTHILISLFLIYILAKFNCLRFVDSALLYTWNLKAVPLSGGASPYGRYRECPRTLLPLAVSDIDHDRSQSLSHC